MLRWLQSKKKTQAPADDTPPKSWKPLLSLQQFSTIQQRYWVCTNEKEHDESVWCSWRFGLTPPTNHPHWRNPTYSEALHRQYMWDVNRDFYLSCVGD